MANLKFKPNLRSMASNDFRKYMILMRTAYGNVSIKQHFVIERVFKDAWRIGWNSYLEKVEIKRLLENKEVEKK